jgi:MYXO-CTERM domain-containing protein
MDRRRSRIPGKYDVFRGGMKVLRRHGLVSLLAVLVALVWSGAAHADGIFATNYNEGTMGEYNAWGGTVNSPILTGLSQPEGIAPSGSNLFDVNGGSGTIGEYDTWGATVHVPLITEVYSTGYIAAKSKSPVSISPAALLLASGLGGLAAIRRRFIIS